MKAALIMPVAHHLGGAEYTLKQLLRQTSDHDIEWVVIFFEDGPMVSEVARDGVTTHVIQTGRLRQLAFFVGAVRGIARIIKENDCDVVMSWSGKAHIYGGLAASMRSIPSIWYQQGCPSGVHLSSIDRLATFVPSKLILCVSHAAQRAQENLRPKRPTRVVYSGIELDYGNSNIIKTQEGARRELNLPAGIPIVGIVGRLQRWKGIHVLIEAMPEVLAKYPRVRCIVVGGRHDLEPDYEDLLIERIDQLDLGHCVEMVGYQSEFRLWMSAMDIVVHASDHEPLGLVVLEAMALRKAVVASNSGGPPEVIDQGENGLLTPFGDCQAMAASILTLLDRPQYAAKIAEKAALRAQDFGVKVYTEKIMQALNSVTVA